MEQHDQGVESLWKAKCSILQIGIQTQSYFMFLSVNTVYFNFQKL